MSAPKNRQEVPAPSPEWTGAKELDAPAARSLGKMAKLWRPLGTLLEPVGATLARYAHRLIDRKTGVPYSADELEEKILGQAGSGGALLARAELGGTVQEHSPALDSWAGVNRASGFDSFAANPTSEKLRALVTDDNGGSGGLLFADGLISAGEFKTDGHATYHTGSSWTYYGFTADDHLTALTQGSPSTGQGGIVRSLYPVLTRPSLVNDGSGAYTVSISHYGTLTANRSLTLNVIDGSRTLTISGDAALNQVLTTTSSPTFNGISLSGGSIVGFAGLYVTAGGSNNNIGLTPSGTGAVVISGQGGSGMGVLGVTVTANTDPPIMTTAYGAASMIMNRRANGIQAAPAALATNDLIGGVMVRGHTGFSFTAASNGGVYIYSAEGWSTGANGTYITLEATASGGTTRTEKMRVLGNGRVLIGTTTDNGFQLAVNGAVAQSPGASVTPAVNGQVVVQATSNTSLTFKLRGSDGVVRSASLTLA